MSLTLGFAGTPAFATVALAALLDEGFDVALVLTRTDRPRGRGLRVEPSPVKILAERHGVPVHQPATLRTADARAPILAQAIDVLVVAAYGLILPLEVLAWPRHGCLNVHASLLPRWRGAAPIQRALLAGDRSTGVSIMQMDAGLDTGPVVARYEIPIAPDETAGTLHDRLAELGACSIVRTLRVLERDGRLVSTPQPGEGAAYATRISRHEAAIDWNADAATIDRVVRAFAPVPGAYASLPGHELKILRARPVEHAVTAAPGTVLNAASGGIDVACGEGVLRILDVKPAGGRAMTVGAFLAGHFVAPGARFMPTPDSPVAGDPSP